MGGDNLGIYSLGILVPRNLDSENYSLGPGVYSRGVYNLGLYSLGAYTPVRRDLEPDKHSLGLGVYSLGVYNLVRRDWSRTCTH